jgi:hypothetical protein
VLLFNEDEERSEAVDVVEDEEEEEEEEEEEVVVVVVEVGVIEKVASGSFVVGFIRVNCSGLSQIISSSLTSNIIAGRGRTKNGSKSTQKINSDGSIDSFRPHL